MPTIPKPKGRRQCPHCREHFHSSEAQTVLIRGDRDGRWVAFTDHCPACDRIIIILGQQEGIGSGTRLKQAVGVYPAGTARPPLSPDVPAEFTADYLEACQVLPHSAKASAALSRRALQYLLRTKAGMGPGDLAKEIDQLLDSKTLPSHLHRIVDMIRGYGNFGTHPIPNTQTGAIIAVEPGEGECLLEILEALFDAYFVQPTIWGGRKAALDKKLADAGKPPSKG